MKLENALNRRWLWLIILISLTLSLSASPLTEKEDKMLNNFYSETVRAIDFPAHLEWLNTAQKYSLKDFKGKIVLLDFWTYCCINCMHVIPDLKRLEEKYPQLIVIGVHSAKFHNERIKENIQQAILRYDIEHPVVIDNEFVLWRAYGINAWPSFVVIDPAGKVVEQTSGERIFKRFDTIIGSLSQEFQEKGLLNRERFQFQLLKDTVPQSVLYFPGKITAHSASKRLFFTDSNHNRIIVANPDGEIIDIVGSGEPGRSDGDFNTATFFRPQGLAFDEKRNCLYVADTENHLIRKADFTSKRVTTILGTEAQARFMKESERGTDVQLNSPWDIIILGDYLYIAMAGSHQIWRMHLQTLEASVYAGSGYENITDGPLPTAALSQPSGITTDGKVLYIADSEVSAIRKIEDNTITTIIGVGLFEFGDIDGFYPEARLQHPIGVFHHHGVLYVADTYNHKIKKVNPQNKEVRTFIGTGKRGFKDGKARKAQLNEPNDITYLAGRFYITDTNNHAIRIYNPEKDEISTFQFKNLAALSPLPAREEEPFQGKRVTLPEKVIAPHTKGIHFRLRLPENYKWNEEAPNYFQVLSEKEDVITIPPFAIPRNLSDVFIPIKINKSGNTVLKIQVVTYFCEILKEELCYFEAIELSLPISVKQGGTDEVGITYNLLPGQSR